MSLYVIHKYQKEVEDIIHFGGTKKETAIRSAFHTLLNEYAQGKGLKVVTEVSILANNSNRKVTPDGTLKDSLRQDWGYWESKDESDDINEEIRKKFSKGYPTQNILFEDSQTAILFHNGIETSRVSMKNAEALHRLLTDFVNYERPEVRHFRQAIELFKQDIPKVTSTLRIIIEKAEKSNKEYKKYSKKFLKICHDSINPNVTTDDVREMIIQHILTEDVFNTIFDENQFHRENNIARELEKVISTFFTGPIRKTALSSVQHYYQAINAAAAGIADHHEKQKFLKVIYETFYKSYNPKAADRLGVVYTPNEIVNFMIKGSDYLLHKHFNKFLEDPGVEILDPATGTGTFITDIIDYIGKDKLEFKYKNELHANEVAILPYYISNLNIEFTYNQKMGKYEEFTNLCFVDTLDNLGFTFMGKQTNLFAPFSQENSLRIIKQNTRKISVIIGNPPYNANQLNENENNKNREYPEIDKRIKDTFIKYSKAQKTKVYDMYARFYRWAFDRIQDKGVIAFVTNRSFIDSKTFDGFRKIIQTEFDFAYIIDTISDVRANPKIAGTTHNVFGIQTGVAIMFLIKKPKRPKGAQCSIFYAALFDEWKKEQKLQWFTEHSISSISFTHIQPDKNNNWLNNVDNDFDTLLPLYSRGSKKAIFNVASNGISTNRDEWVYDFNIKNLKSKVRYFIKTYNSCVNAGTFEKYAKSIKWSRDLKNKLSRKILASESDVSYVNCNYRPFTKKTLALNSILNDVISHNQHFFKAANKAICINGNGADFRFLAIDTYPDLHYTGDTKCFPLYQFGDNNELISNISDWALNKFISYYKIKSISKDQIFNYIYAVLHFPVYLSKYEMNLKRDFPKIPFYTDFSKWQTWGATLIDMHINYETAIPFQLKEVQIGNKTEPKAKLKANKLSGVIVIDENTELHDVPPIAWEYKIGNRSGIEWILDQYKGKRPKDESISPKFDSYLFASYKKDVIMLIKRVCTISVESMNIISMMTN